jgi:hypothetical protein
MSTMNIALIVIAITLGALNMLASGRAAYVIAGVFARLQRPSREELPPPSSHRLQHC